MSQENGLAVHTPAPQIMRAAPQNFGGMDMQTLGRVLAASGYFKDARSEAQAIVKVLYGQEIGVGPVSSMMGIHIIEGKPAPSANLVATMVKRSGRYNYRVTRWDNTGCELVFTENGKDMGPASFDEADARAANLLGKGPWKSYPKAMYFARAMTMGARTYCPDVFGGAPVYTPEELGAEVDDEGNPLVANAPLEAEVVPETVRGGIDDHGYVWCNCGERARYVRGKSGNGFACHHSPAQCDYKLKDTGQQGLVRPPAPAELSAPLETNTSEQTRQSPGADQSDLDAYARVFNDATAAGYVSPDDYAPSIGAPRGPMAQRIHDMMQFMESQKTADSNALDAAAEAYDRDTAPASSASVLSRLMERHGATGEYREFLAEVDDKGLHWTSDDNVHQFEAAMVNVTGNPCNALELSAEGFGEAALLISALELSW